VEALRRRQREVIEVQPLVEAYRAAPDDILLAKLEWFRMGGETSERQWRDVLGIIKLQLFDLTLSTCGTGQKKSLWPICWRRRWTTRE
jgi:hypothetical protein